MSTTFTTTAGIVGQTARAIIGNVLQSYGLESLSTWAWNEVTSGASTQQVLLDMYQTPQFKARFPGIVARQQQGLPPISPADYISYETQMRQLEHTYGLPTGFLSTPARVGELVGGDVSASEVSARIQQGYAAVAYAPPEVRQAFTAQFGPAGDGAMASYFLTPKASLPVLEQQATAAQFTGIAGQGSIQMSPADAMELAQMGVSPSAVQSGVSALEQEAPLFSPRINEQTAPTAGTTGIEAQFGLSAAATQAVTEAQATREAQFKGGGGPQMDTYQTTIGHARPE